MLVCIGRAISTAILLIAQAKTDTLRVIRLANIGADSSANAPFLFGEISGLAFDDQARLYVTDFQEPRVVVLDSTGRVLGIIGRKGEGPGEFIAPTGPVIGPDGALYVRNLTKISRLVRESGVGLPTRFDRYIIGPAMLSWRLKVPTVIDDQGRLYWPNPQTPRGQPTEQNYLRFDLAGQLLDSLRAPAYSTAAPAMAWVQTDRGGGRMVAGLSVVPFAPLPVYAVTAKGTIVSGGGDSYLLVETNEQGHVVNQFARKGSLRRIPTGELKDSLRALQKRIDSLPVPIGRLEGTTDAVRSQRLPETYPAYTGVVTQPNGDLWVRRWATRHQETVFDVFNAHASYLSTVVLPTVCATLPPPVSRGRHVACMVVDEDSGGESVFWGLLPRGLQ